MIEANTINNLDCLDGLTQMPDGCAKLIVADPPYFMGLTHNGQHGQFNDLAVAKPFYRQLAQQLRRILNDHGEFYIFMDWRGCAFYYPIFAEYLPVKNMIVWDKMSGPGNFYNSSHEFILYGCIDPQTKKHARNVWTERGFTSGSIQTDGEKIHPSQKPIALIQRIITDASVPGDLVVDPFAGSCTTAVACIRTGRRYVCFEVSETYAAAGQARVDKLLAERRARNTKNEPPARLKGQQMETYTEKAIKAIATGNAPAEQAALEAVIAEAVKKAVKETRRQDQQQALHNTALLMENYRALKGYEGRAVDSADAARLQGAEIQGEAWLRSIRKNKARTAVMLAHLDAALDELEKETRQKGRAYMFDAYRARYMEGLTAEQVAEKLNTGKNSPARWCKQLNERLAVLLFGVDGLRRW